MVEGEKFLIDFDTNILPWVGRTSKVLDYYISDFFKDHGVELTKAQIILLFRVTRFNGAAQNSLADITNRDKASLARLIDTMEKKNLVARIPSKSDGRVNEIHITKKGQEVLKQTLPILKKIDKVVHQDITDKEISILISIMKKINKNINSEQFVAPLTK